MQKRSNVIPINTFSRNISLLKAEDYDNGRYAIKNFDSLSWKIYFFLIEIETAPKLLNQFWLCKLHLKVLLKN